MRIGFDYESVRIENIATGQRIGPYRIQYAREQMIELGEDDYRLLDLNFEEVM